MKLTNKEGKHITNKKCKGGCICHMRDWRLHKDNINESGCCTNCGCPYTEEGFENYAKTKQER